jgi:isoleucyl-tRNA synthetase
MPKVNVSIDFRSAESRLQKLMAMRDEVLRVLEALRQEKKIASNQEACVTIYCIDKDSTLLNEFGLEQFAALCIVSEVKLQKAAGQTMVVAEKSSYNKCQRCWNYWPSVGADNKHPDLCKRCIKVIHKIDQFH